MSDEERRGKMAEMLGAEVNAEFAYDAMYEAGHPNTAMARYCDVKDYMSIAIQMANDLGLKDDAERLNKRLDHIKAVYRSQFTY